MSELCDKCGNQIENSDKFCPHCGNPQNNQSVKNECPKCNHLNPEGALFCEKCGTPAIANASGKLNSNHKNKIVSKGSYSGEMIKGRTSKGWKIFRNIIIGIVLLGIIALFIWFQLDPEADKKLADVLTGIGFMIVFFFFGWLFMRGKKGKRQGWDDDQYADVNNDNDYNSDDED